MITHLLRSIEKNTNKNCRNSFVLVYTVLCSPQRIFLLLFISQHFLPRYQIRQSDREFATVHHVVEEELSTQPTIILFFAGCFDRGQIFWGVTALFPQRACLFVMVYSRGHARDQGVCGAGSHKHLYFHSQHGFQNHLHRYQVSILYWGHL